MSIQTQVLSLFFFFILGNNPNFLNKGKHLLFNLDFICTSTNKTSMEVSKVLKQEDIFLGGNITIHNVSSNAHCIQISSGNMCIQTLQDASDRKTSSS